MVIQQGDVVWVDLPPPLDHGPAGRHPCVVLQRDGLNRSALATTIVVTVTSNLKYAALPGNVRLSKGEAGLPKPSVVNVTQVATVSRTRIDSKLGSLSRSRLAQVWEGVRSVLQPDEI